MVPCGTSPVMMLECAEGAGPGAESSKLERAILPPDDPATGAMEERGGKRCGEAGSFRCIGVSFTLFSGVVP